MRGVRRDWETELPEGVCKSNPACTPIQRCLPLGRAQKRAIPRLRPDLDLSLLFFRKTSLLRFWENRRVGRPRLRTAGQETLRREVTGLAVGASAS
jgi:hypothetical protein